MARFLTQYATLLNTAVREFAEETGLLVPRSQFTPCWVDTDPTLPDYSVILDFRVLLTAEQQQRLATGSYPTHRPEHHSLGWYNTHDLHVLNTKYDRFQARLRAAISVRPGVHGCVSYTRLMRHASWYAT